MEKFNKIYPFTTENISGYLKDLDLEEKSVITVLGSTDHVINLILKGVKEIYTFDINPLTKYYLDLKLSLIQKLTFNEFVGLFLNENSFDIDYNFLSKLNMNKDSLNFWKQKLKNKSLKYILQSNLFERKYFNKEDKIRCNLYLNESNYEIVKCKIKEADITFECLSIEKLKINKHYDYMFLSNISDYINLIFGDNYLKKYRDLIFKFKNNVDIIYYAYIYDFESTEKRSEIDDIDKVKEVFKDFNIKIIDTALITNEKKYDAVLYIGRN